MPLKTLIEFGLSQLAPCPWQLNVQFLISRKNLLQSIIFEKLFYYVLTYKGVK